jgi:hypothetical protein
MVAVAAALGGGAWWGRRRHDRAVVAAAGLGLLLLAGALVTAFVIPLGIFAVAPHQLRWLWPIAVFVTFAVALAVLRSVPSPVVATAVAVAAVAVLSGLNLPAYNARTGPSADAESIPSARRLLAQLGPLEGKGPVLLETRRVRFADPYLLAVMADLQRRGVEFHVDEPTMIHQVGRSRTADGSERVRVFELDRQDALSTPPGATLVARVVGLTAAQRTEMASLRAQLGRYIQDRGLPLNDAGRAAVAIGALHDVPPSGVIRSAEPFIQGDDFVLLVRRDLATIDPAWRGRFVRYVDLLEEWQKRTVAIYSEPLP